MRSGNANFKPPPSKWEGCLTQQKSRIGCIFVFAHIEIAKRFDFVAKAFLAPIVLLLSAFADVQAEKASVQTLRTVAQRSSTKP